jgi:Arc/MetJ-type ribon-helix-helix transcriptional regulator
MSELIRTHFSLPKDLVEGMDDLVGKGNRNSLAVEILGSEVRRRRLMRMLSDDKPMINSDEHPEWRNGAYQWVRDMRDEDDKRSREKLGDWLSPRE